MTAIITNKFRLFNNENLIESFSETNPELLYLFIAKDDEWSGVSPGEWGGTASETTPPNPLDSVQAVKKHWDDMIALKKMNTNDISRVIRRIDWTSGTVYDYYNHETDDLPTKDFYVVNSEFNVYKCIWNNNGAQSTEEPLGQSTSVITTTADNYKWKFMYQIQTVDAVKFMNDDWIPVKRLDSDDGTVQWSVQQAAVHGKIDFIEITDGGSGYIPGDSISISGDGSSATAEVGSVDGTGAITDITIINGGSGYSQATATASVGGSGAILKVIISPAGGHGYDAVKELGGFFSMINVIFQDDEGGNFPVNDDFRKFGIVMNPKLSGGSWPNFGGDALAGSYPAASIEKLSGDIVYIQNRIPIHRAADQAENVKLIISN